MSAKDDSAAESADIGEALVAALGFEPAGGKKRGRRSSSSRLFDSGGVTADTKVMEDPVDAAPSAEEAFSVVSTEVMTTTKTESKDAGSDDSVNGGAANGASTLAEDGLGVVEAALAADDGLEVVDKPSSGSGSGSSSRSSERAASRRSANRRNDDRSSSSSSRSGSSRRSDRSANAKADPVDPADGDGSADGNGQADALPIEELAAKTGDLLDLSDPVEDDDQPPAPTAADAVRVMRLEGEEPVVDAEAEAVGAGADDAQALDAVTVAEADGVEVAATDVDVDVDVDVDGETAVVDTEPVAKTDPVVGERAITPVVDPAPTGRVDSPVVVERDLVARTEVGPVVVPAAKTPAPVSPLRELLDRNPFRRRRRVQARKVRRVVRHIDPWSVLTFSVVFHLCVFAALLLASVLVWNAAESAGTIENLETFILELGDYESFEINGEAIFQAAVAIAGILTLASVLLVLLTVVFNLISDLVGGIRMTVIEEETVRVRRKKVARSGNG